MAKDTRPNIILELTADEAEALSIILVRGIHWDTPVVGPMAEEIYIALNAVGVETPPNPRYSGYAYFI